jgi:hypothetical protein
MSEYTKDQLLDLAHGMRDAANRIYPILVQCNVHPFIEFNGLMQKYVDICQNAARKGIAFPDLHEHSGEAVPVEAHDMLYLAEKLRCIFGPALDADPKVREAFLVGMFGRKDIQVDGDHVVIPTAAARRPELGEGVTMTPDVPFKELYLLEECLTNLEEGTDAPKPGETYDMYLLGRIDHPTGEHCVVTVTGKTDDELGERLTRFVERADVIVLEKPERHD